MAEAAKLGKNKQDKQTEVEDKKKGRTKQVESRSQKAEIKSKRR